MSGLLVVAASTRMQPDPHTPLSSSLKLLACNLRQGRQTWNRVGGVLSWPAVFSLIAVRAAHSNSISGLPLHIVDLSYPTPPPPHITHLTFSCHTFSHSHLHLVTHLNTQQVINALWRLLSHDLDRVLKAAANGALKTIRDKDDGTGAAVAAEVSVEEAALVLSVMAKIFMVSWVVGWVGGWVVGWLFGWSCD